MQPWKKISLTEDQLQMIYREWGIFYTHKQKLDIATDYYDISLNLKTDPKALFNRSRCKRSIAQTDSALRDARAALASEPLRQPYNLEVCDALYQLNEFEKTKCVLFDSSLKFEGLKLDGFNNRSHVLDENFAATLGETLGHFILEHRPYLYKALEELNREKTIEKRPLWKVLKEQEKCDVLSVLEKEILVLSPREFARRSRAFNIFNQIYMRKSWIDVLFLKALKSDPNLLLSQSQWSKPLLQDLTKNKYNATIRFLRMLHARSPLYTAKFRKCPNKKLSQQRTEEHLYRVQYQVHRNTKAMLKRMLHLRETKKIDKLSKYVEQVMGEYVVLKTGRVFPWKFEFLQEVYNLLALTHIDMYVDTPKNIFEYAQAERLSVLLKMPKEKDKEQVAFVFGNRSTYQDQSVTDVSIIRQKQFLARMEKRIVFAKYPIEKCYILHEIARSHLKNSRFDECCIAARKSIEESKICNSLVWNLLGLLLICKSHAVLRKVEKINETLIEATGIAHALKDGSVQRFIGLLAAVNARDTQEKKAQEELRKTKSRQSILSSQKSSIGSLNRS